MLTSLTLTNFRGFSSLEIPRLARVNLIGGINNSGKTAILEAVYLLLERDDKRVDALPRLFRPVTGIDEVQYHWRWLCKEGAGPELWVTARVPGLGLIRHTSPWTEDSELFKDKAWLTQAILSRTGRNGRTLIVEDDGPSQPGNLPVWPRVEGIPIGPTPPVEDAQVYAKAVRHSAFNESRMEGLLRNIEPRLKILRTYPDEQSNLPVMHVGFSSGETLPASQLGQGFNRLLRVYSSLLGGEAKVGLVDEVGTGLHHSVLPVVWKGLAAIARQENLQIFATTHSREAILAAHRVFSEEPEYNFAYHRLERDAKGEVQVVTYDQERLEGADERNFELR